MAGTRRLNELVSSALVRFEPPPGPVTVALSGGADSAALALLAVETGAEVSLIHVHHGLDASDLMAEAAERIASRLGAELVTARVEVAPGASPEARAREARYQALHSVTGHVLTGHTRDDTVETLLINLIRGTGIDGLAGIPYHRSPNVYRPILSLTRGETREIASLAGLEFRDDPMNVDLGLTRNRVRQVILPRMRELNPQVDAALARTAASVRADVDYLQTSAGGDLPTDLAVAVVTTMPTAVADRLLRHWLEAKDVTVSADLLDRVWSVARGRSERQDLEGGRRVVRDGAVLRIESAVPDTDH